MIKRRSSRIAMNRAPVRVSASGVTGASLLAMRSTMRGRLEAVAQSLRADAATSRLPIAIAVWILAVIALIGFMHWAGGLLVSLLLGIILTYTLAPFVNWLEMRHIHRAIGATLVVSLLLGGVGWMGVGLSGQVQAIANELPDVARKLRLKITKASAGDGNVLRKVQDAASELDKAASESTAPKGAKPAPAAPVTPAPVSSTLRSWLGSNLNSLMHGTAQAVIIVMLAYSLLVAGPLFRRKLLAIVGPNLSDRKDALRMLDEIQHQMQIYFLGLTVSNALIGLAIWGVFFAMGVENPGFWGVAAALLHFIPYAGSAVLALASGLAMFLQTGTYGGALMVAGVALAVNTAIGIGVLTWMQARVYRVSTAVLFLSLLFFGWLWGAWGVLLAAPLVGVAKVICDRVPALQRLGVLLEP
jgi:predicted PurR-regulated permease PerM